MTPWSVDSLQFGQFLNAVFDIWIREDIGDIGIQLFEQTLAAWCGLPPQVCVFAPTCGSAFAMEMNGDVYNCDHFVYPQFKLGNIHQKTLRQMNQANKIASSAAINSVQWRRSVIAVNGSSPAMAAVRNIVFYPLRQAQPIITICVQVIQAFFSHTATAMSAMRTLYEKGISPAEIKSIFV